MTDRDQAELRGPVKMCAVEREYIYPDRPWVMHTSSTFSEDGDLVEQHHQNPDGTEWSIVCHCDDRGRVSHKEHREPNAVKVLSYHYDAEGRLERVSARLDTGAEWVCESYRYDQAGGKMATIYPDPALRDRMDVGVDIEAAFSAIGGVLHPNDI